MVGFGDDGQFKCDDLSSPSQKTAQDLAKICRVTCKKCNVDSTDYCRYEASSTLTSTATSTLTTTPTSTQSTSACTLCPYYPFLEKRAILEVI